VTLDSVQRRDRFRDFYESTYPSIYAFVLRQLHASHHDASDVTAEIFATAWRRRDQIPSPPEDRLWIYGVARRILSRHQRGSLRRWKLVQRLGNEALVRDQGGYSSDAGDRERVQAAIARLKPSDRGILGLVLWEELNHEEAAQVLGCSVNAVAVRLHRAKKRLKKELGISSSQRFGQDANQIEKKED